MGDLVGQFLATPERSLLGNSPDAWVFAAVTAAAAWAVLWLLRELIAIRYRRYLSGAGMPPIRILPDLVGATRQFFMIAVALFAAQSNLALPAQLHASLQRLLLCPQLRMPHLNSCCSPRWTSASLTLGGHGRSLRP